MEGLANAAEALFVQNMIILYRILAEERASLTIFNCYVGNAIGANLMAVIVKFMIKKQGKIVVMDNPIFLIETMILMVQPFNVQVLPKKEEGAKGKPPTLVEDAIFMIKIKVKITKNE